MKVPFLDLRPDPALEEELAAAARRVIASGRYVMGPELEAFEEEFAGLCGTRFCRGVGNGLDALRLALEALGIGPGDEVVVPAHTFIATWLAVSHVGAEPVPVDADPVTMNLDVERVEEAITPRTRAVVVVHLYGLPADVEPLRQLCRRRGLKLIEDAAQAHGALYHGRPVGSLGDIAAFSFYPAKNLGALGDGGAVVTDDPDLDARVRRLRNYGSDVKYVHEGKGHNSRLDSIQAAFLRVRLARLGDELEHRRSTAELYLAGFADAPELKLPASPDDRRAVWHLFVIRHPDRGRLAGELARRGVDTLVHYPTPPHRSPAYAEHAHRTFPVCEEISETVLSLPIGPHVGLREARHVVESVLSCLETRATA